AWMSADAREAFPALVEEAFALLGAEPAPAPTPTDAPAQPPARAVPGARPGAPGTFAARHLADGAPAAR
ncbi:hypothetical protein ACFU6G_31825, partial [Streptomyces sp. NPDC057494]